MSMIAKFLASTLPHATSVRLIEEILAKDPNAVIQAVGPLLNRKPNLDTMPFDLPIQDPVQFENLAGLFASTNMDHGVISMPVRQVAYIFSLVRRMGVKKAIEIGRYKGGSTLVLTSAMGHEGTLWSIDLGDKEERLAGGITHRPYRKQVEELCSKLGFTVHLIDGDSRTVQVDTGEVDLAFIDGDHTYEGVKIDFERFGTRVRVGGAVLFDDTFSDGLFSTHSDTVGRLVREIDAQGKFKLVKSVNRLAHLERMA